MFIFVCTCFVIRICLLNLNPDGLGHTALFKTTGCGKATLRSRCGSTLTCGRPLANLAQLRRLAAGLATTVLRVFARCNGAPRTQTIPKLAWSCNHDAMQGRSVFARWPMHFGTNGQLPALKQYDSPAARPCPSGGSRATFLPSRTLSRVWPRQLRDSGRPRGGKQSSRSSEECSRIHYPHSQGANATLVNEEAMGFQFLWRVIYYEPTP